MFRSQIDEMIASGLDSRLVLRSDDVRPEDFARDVVAIANRDGGRIVLGVSPDRRITGIQRTDLEGWVFRICDELVHPPLLPFYEEVQMSAGRRVAVVTVSPGHRPPHVVRRAGGDTVYVRVGSESRPATREQLALLYASAAQPRTELWAISRATPRCLDLHRIRDYLANVLNDPEIPTTSSEWEQRCESLGFLVPTESGGLLCSIAGLVLFGIKPRRFLRQTGLRLMVFDGPDMDYAAKLDVLLDAPLVGRWERDDQGRQLVDAGLIEHFMELLTPHISMIADPNEQLRRDRIWHYPLEAVREVVLNALTHRDWTRSIEVEVVVYSDRMVITSPGALPNSMTIAKMLAGQRSPRNILITEIVRDYGYVDNRGMGVRRKVLPLMRRENHVEPEFEVTEDYVRTVLRRAVPTES